MTLQNARSIFLARRRAEEELLRAREELARQSELLQVTLESIGDAVITSDLEGNVQFLNPVAEELTGWSRAEALGKPLDDVFRVANERSMQPVENPAVRALREGRIVGLENHSVLISRSGAVTPIEDSAAPIRGAGGKILGVVLVFRSIADRLKAEQARQRSEQELADFFDNASIGMHLAGPDGTILRVNRAELELLGYSPEEYVGRRVADFHVDLAVLADIEARLAAGETVRDRDVRLRCKDGSARHVRVDASVLWHEGRFVHTRTFTRDVTDRKRADEAQARLAAIVESSQDAIIGKDIDGTIRSWNKGAQELFGYAAEEAIGRRVLMLIPADRQDEEQEILARLRRGERVEHYETVRVRKDGRRIDVSLTISPLRDAAGNVVGASKIARDVTARKGAERRLSMQNAVTRILAEAPDLEDAARRILKEVCTQLGWRAGAFWRHDADRDVVTCLAVGCVDGELPRFVELTRGLAFARGTGLPGRVWDTGRPLWVPDLAGDGSFARADAAKAEGLHGAFGVPIVLGQQVLGAIEFFSDAIEEPDAQLLQTMVAIGSAVGQFIDRRTAEAARRKAVETSRFLADASAELAAITDRESTLRKVVTLAVPRFADWCTVDVLESDGIRRLAVSHRDPSLADVARELQRSFRPRTTDPRGVGHVIGTGKAEWAPSVTEEELAESTRGGRHLELLRALGCSSWITVPLTTRGRTLGALSFVMGASGRAYDEADARAAEDLANRTVIAIENAGLVATLKESDRRKDEFLAMLSHELRNPLAPIRNAVQLLRGNASGEREMQWSTEVIDRQVHHMTRLVDDLLDVSRIATGKIELRREIVEIATIVRNAVEASRPLVEQRRHELQVLVPTRPIRLDADPARLAQVVSNLLNNAAKYTPPGGHIKLTVREHDGLVEILVEDDGTGISPEMLPRVFDMFAQAPRAIEHSDGGLGIGLTLVRRLVQLHGGTVEARSEGVGKGSLFIVRLQTSDRTEQTSSPPAPEPAATAPMRILVVDDHEDAAESLGMLLGMMGHEVRTAHDGLQAVDAAAEFRPDVAFLDIGLPNLSGEEVARRVRAHEEGGAVLLVALTGWGQEDDRRRTREAGFDHHITKPVSLEALHAVLEAGARRPRRA